MRDEGAMYVIRNDTMNLLQLCGIMINGVECTMPAIFYEEDKALEILFWAIENKVITGHWIVDKKAEPFLLNPALPEKESI